MPPALVNASRRKLRIKGKEMAGNGDMKAHQETYLNVMSLFRWAAVGVFVVGAIVILLIGS
jgi:hypothetical protein